jgi:hypothetical protein
LVVAAICGCVLAGCFQWTEDQQGNLQSVGVPGLPLWKSKTPPAPIKLTDMGMTPEEASKVSGPVLVLPPDQSTKAYRYKYYPTGHNNCPQDLARLLSDRASSNAAGDPPYCTETPTAPSAKGNAFVF